MAMAKFRSSPEYASVQVQIADESDELAKQLTPEAKQVGTDARMKHVVCMFDICAKAYLRLVCDLEMQKAYETYLDDLTRRSWEQFTGCPFDNLPPLGKQPAPVVARTRYWKVEGYRKIAASARDSGKRSQEPTAGESIKELREECRMTVEQLAEAVKMSARSVERHESGDSAIRLSNLREYESVFSKKLNRTIRLSVGRDSQD
jgi:DNA-binding XRE family transcriptional regulator